jgi:hypothetical protein
MFGSTFGKVWMFKSHEMLDTSSTPSSIYPVSRSLLLVLLKGGIIKLSHESLLPESSEPKVWSWESNQ